MRIDPGAPFATCAHCRTQSRIERVGSGADGAPAAGQPVIRVVVRGGARLLVSSLAVTAVLALMVLAGLAGSYFFGGESDALPDARLAVDLSRAAVPLDGHHAVAVLGDGSIVVSSSSGRTLRVDAGGNPQAILDLPLPAARAQLAGLAPDARGGFYASLGGAILHVVGGAAGPALPADRATRTYGAIATDREGRLHAITASAELVRVGADGLPVQRVALPLPTGIDPLKLRAISFVPDGRVVITGPHGPSAFWFDPARGSLTPIAGSWESIESTLACMPDGSVVFEAGRQLVRIDAQGRAASLQIRRPTGLQFGALAAAPNGDLVALSRSGNLVRYDASLLR